MNAIRAERSSLSLSRGVWVAVGFVAIGFALTAQIFSNLATETEWCWHALWCIAGLVCAFPIVIRSLRNGFECVLRDHLVMFTASFILYFLIGALFFPFGSSEEIGLALDYYMIDAPTALRVDAVNSLGFGIALIAAAFSPRGWLTRQTAKIASMACKLRAEFVMIILIIFSALAISQTWIFDFGYREGVISGAWRTAAQFPIVAIYLGAAYRGRHERKLRITACALSIVYGATGLLLFSKSQTLISIGAFVAGLASRFGARGILSIGLPLLVASYFISGGLVAYGRLAIPIGTPASIAERWSVAKDGWNATWSGDKVAETSAWGRLCYLPPQGAGLYFFDVGEPGDEFSLIPWVFIPRLVVDSKPVITQVGTDLHRKITGNDQSSTGLGVFVGGYYNGGWAGVIFVAIVCGFLLAQTSAVATQIFAQNASILFPVALIGFYMAFRIDGSFLSDYLGAFVFALYPLLFIAAIVSIQRRARPIAL